MKKSAIAIVSVILLASATRALTAGGSLPTTCEVQDVKAPAISNVCPNVATAEKAATYQVRRQIEGFEALEVTARPLTDEPASPYLVEVFVDDPMQRDSIGAKLLGTFSFYPVRVGQAQTFILPKPITDSSTSKELTLSVRLVPANASRALKDTAVEIVGARFVK